MVAIKKFIRDESGASAIEYGLLAALIALVVAVAAKTVGVNVSGVFGRVSTCLKDGVCQ